MRFSKIFKYDSLFILVVFAAVFFRLYHIEFGLPHTFHADEPEFMEPAIKYTYEIKNIIKNNDYYKLIPISFVYGTFPVYLLTFAVAIFSKTLNLFHVGFDKFTLFVFMRAFVSLLSVGIVLFTSLIAKAKNNNSLYFWAVTFLAAFNWKFIVHAHYVNADIILTLLLLASFYWFQDYIKNPKNLNLILAAAFFGLAVGTKITALISLPVFLFVIAKKKDIYGIPGFIFTTILAFLLTNPFSLIFFKEFSFRIFSMLSKEAGMVFDSVDYSPFKYIWALNAMVTTPVLVMFIAEIITKIKNKKFDLFDLFLIANFVIYLAFFSIQSRRVDRWLLPILPIIFIYAAELFANLKNKKLIYFTAIAAGIWYMFNPLLLLSQFQRWTPRAQAYLWVDKNLSETATKLVYTEEGLDPMNKLGQAKVIQFNVYTSEGGQYVFPQNPMLYDYVIISSRVMENYKKTSVILKYPIYTQAWQGFEDTLKNPKYFRLVEDFANSKPNLVPLSDVFVFERVY